MIWVSDDEPNYTHEELGRECLHVYNKLTGQRLQYYSFLVIFLIL